MDSTPTEEGITAVRSLNGEEIGREIINPKVDNAAALAARWLTGQ